VHAEILLAGIATGIRQDLLLTPEHAHLNGSAEAAPIAGSLFVVAAMALSRSLISGLRA
jgi:hypothetical protein